MRQALRLAERGRGRVEPNPMVGCVLVRGGKVLAEGWHRRFGGAHAEVEALRRCKDARGATAYVTLEPCCHWGKTPPCTDALIAARVRRVVTAMRDPNPVVHGGGITKLREAGIRVDVGTLTAEAAALNATFIKLTQQGRPWVILKWAQSIDGKIATRTGDSRWISDERARAHAHGVRGLMDAIVVGAQTALRDDPLLTCRAARPRRIATRVVLDSQLRLPERAQLVRTARKTPTLVFCSTRAPASRRKRLESHGVGIATVRSGRGGLNLGDVLDELGRRRFANVLVEGGGRLLGRMVDEALADEIHVYIAPLLIGGVAAIGALHANGPATVAEALRLPRPLTVRRVGTCSLVCARLWQ